MKRYRATKKSADGVCLLGCWGSFNDPAACDYTYKNMTDWGRKMFVTPGVVVDDKLVTIRIWWTSTSIFRSFWAVLLLRRLGEWRKVRQKRSSRQSCGPESSVESDHDSQTPEARFWRQIYVGDVSALARQADRRPSRARYRRGPNSQAVGHRTRRAWWILATSSPPGEA